jgi:hypothetical protein
MRARRGKQLGGKPRKGHWTRGTTRRRNRKERPSGILVVLAAGLFILGVVAGFGWMMDRQLRGGILRQRAAAAQRPDWVAIGSLPGYVPRAFLAVADPSLAGGQRRRTVVGETPLAQDLVRQIYRLENGLGAEARGLAMGPLLESRLSTQDLLELYLNRVYLGQEREYAVFGVYHAAMEYFGKEPQELTLGEAATLAGLLLPPRITDPQEQAGAVGARRNEVLRQMVEGGWISAEAYRAAVREPLGFQPGREAVPMTRPEGWAEEPPVIRLPPNLPLVPDSATG